METKYIPAAKRLRSFRISGVEFALVAIYVGSMIPQTDLTKITGILLLIIILVAFSLASGIFIVAFLSK